MDRRSIDMNKIQVFNTLSGRKEEFVPLSGNTVKIYACGPTVYDSSHLGHARKEIVWDTVQRYLRFAGYDVIYVRNITDVDDKIIKRATERGISPDRLAREYTYAFWRDMAALNVQAPDYEPRATEFIPQMIKFVQGLIAKGHAYEAKGDVYFDVASFREYGKLGKQNLEELQSGAREQVIAQDALAHLKKSPVDFALWKSADEDELGWPSPWGRGRPGWHLECSTMVQHILGETIDIHSGGEDLVFPHHENEIAQSEALQEKPLAKYWMHNGFIQVSAEKMAKSLGNFKTIQDLLQTYSSDTIRIFVLQTHYRNPIDFTPESLAAVKTGLNRLVRARVAGLATVQTPGVPAANGNGSKDAGGANGNGKVEATAGDAARGDAATASAPSENAQTIARKFSDDFTQAMNNDFNTAVAISLLFQLSDQILALKPTEQDDKTYLASFLTEYAGILGLTLADTRKSVDTTTGGKLVDLLLDLRKEAKSKKDFATADAIRKQLIEIGINVMDTATGATWESDN